ncbi:NAD-dependent epimerase/dehydratase family protein [Sphingobacterium psychroaquaticum]|uniref:Nucleoside-diphosphate-sugar epimerase n=1 Tax=Sphingobacterium psychroaquaticum TaxID=561061 RepID=A0A1X7I554_9SPHI|nr:NAD-dependent epimerase/dehydratase family protein [Sphingobacterium psychroaquaticum]SMG08879.1 Nucleoside-diphosphate-sugar epimerase [Sphingobacterium psychroaquaticum]
MTFLILGCGWVGEAFAHAVKACGHTVILTTTNPAKQERFIAAGFTVLCVDFDTSIDISVFPEQVDYILNSIPATKQLGQEVLSHRLNQVVRVLEKVTYKQQIFLSSVGVYPDETGLYTEESAVDETSNLCYAEQRMQVCPRTIVYRLGGLFGQERIFAKYFQNRVCVTGGQPANFVHQEDVVALLQLGFQAQLQYSVYNITAPEHPLKKEVILKSARRYGFSLPSSFTDEASFQKVVSGERIISELKYTFIYKSPLDF